MNIITVKIYNIFLFLANIYNIYHHVTCMTPKYIFNTWKIGRVDSKLMHVVGWWSSWWLMCVCLVSDVFCDLYEWFWESYLIFIFQLKFNDILYLFSSFL